MTVTHALIIMCYLCPDAVTLKLSPNPHIPENP